MSLPHIAILGGGPAGVGAAFQLRKLQRARVTLFELQDTVGGNAGSFTWQEQRLDYGSHRLHPACDPVILVDIRDLLGSDLLERPRHGRIRLRGRWLHFPLKPGDLIRRVDPQFGLGLAGDSLRNLFRQRPATADSFAAVLLASLGGTICRDFYFPYARKIWGVEPEALSGMQARRRVSANSFGKLIQRVAKQIPGLRSPGSGRFFYPRQGFGQITEAYARAAAVAGADLRLGTRVTALQPPDHASSAWIIGAQCGPDALELRVDHVWSTLPITTLPRIIKTGVPTEVMQAAKDLRFRAMVLIYLALNLDRFTEFDAHYFPQAEVRITRLSEPKNYTGAGTPAGRTVLCAELPCGVGDATWRLSDSELGALVAQDLAEAGLPLPLRPSEVYVRRLPEAYPIYSRDYERSFEVLTSWAGRFPNLITFGRQGLFAHDNTHHALSMAYAAAACVEGNQFNAVRWANYLEEFSRHVVED